MDLLGIRDADDGNKTELTIRMTSAEASRFVELLSSGALDRFGIERAKVDPSWKAQVKPIGSTKPTRSSRSDGELKR